MARSSLSASQARRIVLAAQGFGARPAATGPRQIGAVFDRLGLIQIDSVNVLARSHYLPVFARLGVYDRALLDKAAWSGRRKLFEYWTHEAALAPLATQPLLRWRMEQARTRWKLTRAQIRLTDAARLAVEARGPLAASELGLGAKGAGGWWGWSESKSALERLFYWGDLTAAGRRNSFERVYDLTERVLPPAVQNAPTPSAPDAQRALMEIAGRALGVASESDLADYFRLKPRDARPAIAALVEEGVLSPVTVDGWAKPAFLHREAKVPRSLAARALLSPFDNLIFFRDRAQRLFDAHIRIEIYTPAHKRTHGYYVLPFLLGERIVARVDLKAERKAGALAVQAAYLEAHANAGVVAPALGATLREMAQWLGLERVTIGERGDLAATLRRTMS